MSRIKITDKCLRCGFQVTLPADDAAQAVAAIDELHNAMQPNCDARRNPSSVSGAVDLSTRREEQ